MANLNNLFRGLDGQDPEKLKQILDGMKKGAQVEIANPTEQPAGVEALSPRPADAQAPATFDDFQHQQLTKGMFRSAPTEAAPVVSSRDEQMAASLPNTLTPPEMATPAAHVPAAPRSSGQISDEIQGLENYKDPHKHSLIGRLFKGIAKGYQNWDGSGGIGGLLVNTVGMGAASAASPSVYEGLEKGTREKKLFRSLGVARDREEYESKQASAGMQRENLNNQILTRTADTQSKILDRDTDNVREAGKVAAAAGKKSAVKYNGKWYNRLPDGSETPMVGEDGQQRTELKDVPIATTLSDGTPIFTTGDKALDREITQNLNQNRMDFEAKKLNQADLDKYEQETVKWAEEEAGRKAKVSKLILEGQALQNQAAQFEHQAQGLSVIDADQKADLMAKAAKAREEGNSLVRQGNELRTIATPKPKKPAANLTAPSLKVGSYSEADFTARAKARGITGSQLSAAIAKAKQDGVIK